MIISKAIATPRFLVLSALALLATVGNTARAEFYLRPVAQYTWLPSSSRNADSSKQYNYGGGVVMPTAVRGDHYVASSGSLGGGLSLGGAFGREHRFEVGAEATQTKFTGSYTATPVSPPSIFAPSTPIGPSTTRSCSFKVTSLFATFRQFFGQENAQARPYVGCVLGVTDSSISEDNRPYGVSYYDYKADGLSLTAGLGGGVSIKLWRKASFEAGYRFLASTGTTGSKGFYRNVHLLNLALEQRF